MQVTPPIPTSPLLIVGWDSADFSIIRPMLRTGALPHLAALMDRGVTGDLASHQPFIGPVAWTTVFTGKRPDQHGILSTAEPDPDWPGELRDVPSTSRTSQALWNIATHAGLGCRILNVPASDPAEAVNGHYFSESFVASPLDGDTSVHPPGLRNEYDLLRLRASDVGAELILPFIPSAARVDQRSDPRLATLASILAHTATLQAMAVKSLSTRAWQLACICYPGIAQLSRRFVEYHEFPSPGVSAADFETYRDVVSQGYRLHDMMLGELLKHAGPQATILLLSAHGFRTGRDRSAHAPWTSDELEAFHHRHGVFIAAGPNILPRKRVDGVSILDITPTSLVHLGLAIGKDMPGRPLVEIFDQTPHVHWIDSWEQRIERMAAPAMPRSAATLERERVLRPLRELGYVEPDAARLQSWVAPAIEQRQYNLARALLDGHRPGEASKILEQLWTRRPDRLAFARSLFDAYGAQGRDAEMSRMLQTLWQRGYRGPLVLLGQAIVALLQRRPVEALRHLDAIDGKASAQSIVGLYKGRALLRLREWDHARSTFEAVIETEPNNDQAWAGLARACLALSSDDERAAESALQAVSLRPDVGESHYQLGLALVRLERYAIALLAFERSIALSPHFLPAYRQAIDLLRGPVPNEARASALAATLESMLAHRRRQRRTVKDSNAFQADASQR